MSFSDQLNKITEEASKKLKSLSDQDFSRAKEKLHEILKEDAALIKNAIYDQDLGKFHSIDAPEHVIKKLRDSGLLRD